jgi:thioredoxin-related protein
MEIRSGISHHFFSWRKNRRASLQIWRIRAYTSPRLNRTSTKSKGRFLKHLSKMQLREEEQWGSVFGKGNLMKKVLSALIVCCVAGALMAADLPWLTSLPDAKAKAEKGNKLLFLDFTGSDWCGWCMKLDAEVFSKPEFADYAKKNLVLVQVDFPHNKELPADVKAANDALGKKYDISGYPTLIAMKPDGTVVWKQVGYMAGGPAAWIAKLDEAKAKLAQAN